RGKLEGRVTTQQGDVAEREVVVVNSCTGSNGCGSLAKRIPGEAQTRLEVVIVLLEDLRRESLLHTEVTKHLINRVVIARGQRHAEHGKMADRVARQLLAGNRDAVIRVAAGYKSSGWIDRLLDAR